MTDPFIHADRYMADDDDGCPYCHANLWDAANGSYRLIGVEIQGVYDGALFYQCPDCGERWHRFEDERMRARAEPYVSGGKEL